MEAKETQQATARPRITNACEACRSAKVKCQASNQLGICKRCLDSKRECIFKTGPRTRRPRQSKRPDSTTPINPLPPPAGPSKTFTIDIPMPVDDDVADSFEGLRLHHEGFINDLTPDVEEGDEEHDYDDYDYEMADSPWLATGGAAPRTSSNAGSVVSHASSLPVGASALSTPPSSVAAASRVGGSGAGANHAMGTTKSKTTAAALGLRPQFNLDSASALLATFREVMVAHFPCIVLDDGEASTVASMAKERPFVLLAILAAASSSRTLQGHSLYDEEFRKILGLKFVAGGERSLELLQGLVVYVAWYPFHLRPKNKQAFQYIRMAAEILDDFDSDQDFSTEGQDETLTPERLDQIRTYLATYYLGSHIATSWNRTPALPYSDYTAKCCDILHKHSNLKGDSILVWKVRLQRLVEETHETRKLRRGHPQTEYQTELILKGIESQCAEWETRMAPEVANSPAIKVAVFFTRIFIIGAPLLKLPSARPINNDPSTWRPTPQRLLSVVPWLHALFDYCLTLTSTEINAFVGTDWGGLILGVILGYRMSFPLTACPEWDDSEARRHVRFGEYIDRLCRLGDDSDGDDIRSNLTPASSQKSMDILSASKVVLGVVRTKYKRRVAKLEKPPPPPPQPQPQPSTQPQQLGTAQATWGMPPHPGLDISREPGPGCPMLDGSLESYYPFWDETFATNHLGDQPASGQGGRVTGAGKGPGAVGTGVVEGGAGDQQEPVVFNDLWATMTMGWTQDDINFEGL
ncbi:hypothetical protein B0H67DRAFT_596295 [Lasiosphaeris hirsuta]|uniref:Zn(2)-C6 fungal-type domain-containing protein n=1 Tax=Lasiosphaeris hirsuta TaxID=260670 RepID=A0AA40B9E4_9PEZI|nr:hypothetical protein B0H67DRAFT_596295 [Lasiosphaeris hirsuta]